MYHVLEFTVDTQSALELAINFVVGAVEETLNVVRRHVRSVGFMESR